MPNINRVIVAGHLTRDVDLRFTPKGTAMAVFTVAVNRKWKSDGQERDEVAFVDCTAWAKQAEMLKNHFVKGSPIMIEGRLKTESWDDKQTNQKKSKLAVVIEQVHFLGGQETPEKKEHTPEKAAESSVDTDDIPF